MKQLHPDLWVADSSQRFLGLEVGARMTIVRLPEGRLLLHSPIAATRDLVDEVRTMGTVSYLVAPNRFHHLYVEAWQTAFPEAALYVAPGLDEKRPDLKLAGVLADASEPGWADVVEQVRLDGIPLVSEVVLFHAPSATLIATDLAFNVCSNSPLPTRLAFRVAGAYGRLAPTLLERLLVRDRAAFRRSLRRILEWPFERVIVSHGEVCETGGREQLERGYAWIL